MVNRIAPRVLSVAVSLALSGHAGMTFAQSNAAGVEEVTVTARKRAESSQNVDISLSVIDADTINSLRLRNLPEVAAYTQNVTLFEDFPGAGIPTWFIRGVGLQDFNSNNTPTAGVYVDGSYQVATVMGTTALYDVSQVEILKGPQGGLYGRNTSGGAVLVNSNRAVLGQREGSIQLGYGSWDQSLVDGMMNIPLGENLAWRLAGRAENSSGGWQKVISTGEEHGAKDRWDMRSWFTWEPGSGFSAQWKVQGGSDDSEIALGRSIGLYDPRDTSRRPQFCLPVLQGRRDDSNCINFGGSNRIRIGLAPENLSGQAPDGSLVLSDPLNRQQNDYIASVLDLRWVLDEIELVSISAYDNYGYGVTLDLDGSHGEYGHRISTSDMKVMSQEFRLQSAPAETLHWMLGISWSEEKFNEARDFNLRENLNAGLGLGQLFYDQDTTAKSIYGDLTYAFSERWRANAALRYTDEEKHYRNGDFYQLTPPFTDFIKDESADYSLDEPLSGSLSLNFLPREDMFLYAKVSQGFKSGGFYGGFAFSPLDITPYKEETIVAWEAGYKQAWPDQALHMAFAVFTYDYEDVQGFVAQLNPTTGSALDRLTNQGDARHQGVELDFDWQPLELVSFKAGLGWLDAEFKRGNVTTTNIALNRVPIEGDRPYAPEWSGNLLGRYVQRMSNNQSVEWVMGYNYRSEFAGNQSSLVDAAVNKLPGYGVFDFSATLKRDTGPWGVTFWVKNLMDKTYRTRVKSDGLSSFVEFFGEPRSVGITALFKFSE